MTAADLIRQYAAQRFTDRARFALYLYYRSIGVNVPLPTFK